MEVEINKKHYYRIIKRKYCTMSILWIIIAIVMGIWSSEWGQGFWWGFLWSIFATPILAILAILARGR